MSLDKLNQRAADSFERIKAQQGWTRKAIASAALSDDSIDVEKIEKTFNAIPPARVEVDKVVNHLAGKRQSAEINPMDFIDSLELPVNLSIAVAAIIEYGKKGNKKSLVSASEYIEKELRNG